MASFNLIDWFLAVFVNWPMLAVVEYANVWNQDGFKKINLNFEMYCEIYAQITKYYSSMASIE